MSTSGGVRFMGRKQRSAGQNYLLTYGLVEHARRCHWDAIGPVHMFHAQSRVAVRTCTAEIEVSELKSAVQGDSSNPLSFDRGHMQSHIAQSTRGVM